MVGWLGRGGVGKLTSEQQQQPCSVKRAIKTRHAKWMVRKKSLRQTLERIRNSGAWRLPFRLILLSCTAQVHKTHFLSLPLAWRWEHSSSTRPTVWSARADRPSAVVDARDLFSLFSSWLEKFAKFGITPIVMPCHLAIPASSSSSVRRRLSGGPRLPAPPGLVTPSTHFTQRPAQVKSAERRKEPPAGACSIGRRPTTRRGQDVAIANRLSPSHHSLLRCDGAAARGASSDLPPLRTHTHQVGNYRLVSSCPLSTPASSDPEVCPSRAEKGLGFCSAAWMLALCLRERLGRGGLPPCAPRPQPPPSVTERACVLRAEEG